jgi:thioredoxin reductase/CRP-like cAMP-binding protein/Fe-S-cluster-containing hydrogenase component 2
MPFEFEIAIIGAGPAGLGAAHNAARSKISHVLFEKAEIGNTIYDYQLRKHVMAEPMKLPLRGEVPFLAGSRESILEGWNESVTSGGINVRKSEVTAIKKSGEGFQIETSSGSCTAHYVILAIGVQGTPRKLGVPGDDLPHVAYTLADPGAFQGRNVLVIGAGDAAIENALALAPNNTVSILNRSTEFPRAKDANAAAIMSAINAGKVRPFFSAAMARVETDRCFITTPDGESELKCDHIIARLGCILPRKFLEDIGIQFPSKDPNAVPVVNARYESNVPGLFILGALIGYPLIRHALNQGFEVIEHIAGRKVEPADQVLVEERLKDLPGDVNDNLKKILAALPLFQDLSEPQYREMIIDSTVHQLKPGQVVFERNDYTDSFFSVVSGEVAIDTGQEGGVKVGPAGFFGEMGLLSGRRRTATVKTTKESILLETPRKQMLKLISSVASVKDKLDRTFIVRALQTTAFPDADPAFCTDLAGRAKMKLFKRNEVLFKEGDPGDVCYVIRKGSVKISRLNARGVNVTQTYVAAGNLVGEMALIAAEATPRSATVTAAVPVETILIEKADFQQLLDRNPETKKRLQQLAAERHIQNIAEASSQETGQMLDFMMGEGVTDAENFLMIDSDRCISCDNCEKACASTHQGFSRLDRKSGKTYISVQIPVSCRHCENPLCMTDCPPDALSRLPSGEVIIKDSCIGCGNCTRNCPYGVIQLVHDHVHSGPWLLSLFGLGTETEGPAHAAKCDMCATLKGGPACVRSCPTGAAMRVNPSELREILMQKQGESA